MTQTRQLDTRDSIELGLDIVSFAGGENTVGQDQDLKSNESRVNENWESDSFGGMVRVKGFTSIAAGAFSYNSIPDLILHHFEGTTVRNLIVVEGDLAYINGSAITPITHLVFTSGVLSHGVSAGGYAWITNSSDNLKKYSIAGGITTPAGVPPEAMERIYEHKSRLIAEGGSRTVYGSRGGSGNWDSASGWSASGDAWSITMPDLTQGCGVNFPSGNDVTVFTKFGTFVLSGFPNVGFRPIPSGRGCGAPHSIALGTEGLYFLSAYPTLGIYVWDGVNFINLTLNQEWIHNINLSGRIHGVYRENKYWIFYNETGSGVTYQNKARYYDARWGKWGERVINSSVGDNFGIPCVATKSNNELFVTSSRQNIVYDLEDSSNSDDGYNTVGNYKTKDFSSIDFGFDFDELKLKLIKMHITYYGSVDSLAINWTADRGIRSGGIVFNLNVFGSQKLNEAFTLNSSYLAVPPPDKTVTRKFSNNAVGKRFDFQFLNDSLGDRTKIKKVRIYAIVVGDTQEITFKTPSSGITVSGSHLVDPEGGIPLVETGQTIES